MKADLHTHSTASDGTLSPVQLVRLASSSGLTHLALTDHDSVEGLTDARSEADRLGVVLIPGVELSSVSDAGADVHVLGFFVDHTNRELRRRLEDLRAARLRRAESMVAALSAAGIDVSMDGVLHYAGRGSVGRSHVARAIVSAGHADSIHDAFVRLIGRDRPFYVAKDVQSPEYAIESINLAGGIAMIAHPGIGEHRDLILELAPKGLAGVEAYHADHTPEQRSEYSELAARMGLLVSGGSDFHSPAGPNPALGSVDLPSGVVESLLAVHTG